MTGFYCKAKDPSIPTDQRVQHMKQCNELQLRKPLDNVFVLRCPNHCLAYDLDYPREGVLYQMKDAINRLIYNHLVTDALPVDRGIIPELRNLANRIHNHIDTYPMEGDDE